MIYGGTGRSSTQRVVMMTAQTIAFAVALWLLMFSGLETTARVLGTHWAEAVGARRIALAACFVVVYLRMTLTILYLLKRAITWEEAVSVALAFGLYYIVFSLLAGPVARPFGALGIIGIVLFLAGSAVNTLSELLRDRWKRDPANKGKLYTGGLFRYSMHINYFGDVVWVAGLAMITANPWSALVPFLLFCFFVFFNAPQLDTHLSAKYGAAFDEYRKHTKRIIPFIY
jgi:protein-S-isoprenylcysteine O-methyltransferase Ste14